MLRQSIGGRLLAIALAGAMVFNSSPFTALAKGTQSTGVEAQAEEELAQEDSVEQEEETAAEEPDETADSSEQAGEEEDSSEEASADSSQKEAEEEGSDPTVETPDATEEMLGTTEAAPEEEPENKDSEETQAAEDAGAASSQESSEASSQESAETAKVPEVREQKEYTYEDDEIYVVAVLDDAAAVPDDAKLQVTAINESSSDYNYDAYMEALNENAEEKEYNSDNTLLYDVAFLYEEKDAEGNGTGKIIEYQPDFGAVKISISFKQDQLSDQIVTEENENEEVEILHLPLSDSVRDSVDTTADATDISKDDIRVESVQSEQIDVSGENVEFKVSGLSVLSVARPTKAPLRAGAGVTGTISFFNEQATQKAPFEPENTDDYFILVTLKEKEGENAGEIAGWGIQYIPAADITGQSEFAFAVNEFYAFGEDGTTTDTPLDYDASAYDVSSRLFHTTESVTNYQEAIAQDDNIPGYTFMGSKYGANASNSYANPATINLLKKTEDNKFFVQIQVDENGDVPAAGDYFLAVKAERENNQYSYYCAPFTISAGDFDAHNKLDIPITEWTNEDGQTESPAQHFSTNWKSFQVVIAARKPEKKSDPITPKRCIGGEANNFVDQVTVGGLVGAFTLKEDKGVTEETKTTDPHGHEEWRYVLSLEKVKLEPAIEPKNVLGEAVNFGIVADTYNQGGHTETNFAVNSFSSDANLDLDGAGTTPAPFYVGHISGKINPTEKNTASLEFHTPQTEFSKLEMGNVRQPVYVYDTTAESVAAYVKKLQAAGVASADNLLGKTTISPVSTGNKYVLDISGLEDNKTVYVNADGIANAIAQNGLTIKKKPGQYIVFNFSNPGTVDIGEFKVTTVDGGSETTIPSTTIPFGDEGGGAAANQKTDEVILRHITFNAAKASTVHINNASGLFLCPRASEVTNSNGAGWILADGTVRSQGSEWHFFFHDRDVIELGYELKGNKKLTDKDGKTIDYQDKGFKFDIYEEGEDGNETGDVLFSATADSDGVVRFDRRVLTNEDVPKGVKKVFKYIIKEDTSGCVEKDGKYYKDGFEYSDQKIHLVITAENISTNSQPCITVKMTVDGERVDGDIHTVFEFGSLSNKKSEETVDISATKSWSPSVPEGASVVFTLCVFGDPTDKTVTLDGEVDENGESEAWKATFKDLPKYDGETEIEYTVKETTGYVGYTASPESAADGGTITNTQNKVEISAKKAWSPSAPAGVSVVFTLYKNGDPTDQTVTLDGEVDENGESEAWTATFKDLVEYDGETENVYTVKETTGRIGYTATPEFAADGGTITNTQDTVDISAKKAWSPSAPEGASVVFTLYKNGEATAQKVTLDGEVDENGESEAWKATFKDLPKYDGETEIEYTVKETTGYVGYTASPEAPVADGGTITNTQDTVDISAKKAWSPSVPAGASVVFTLYKNGDPTEQTVTLDGEVDENGESEAWTATFTDLPEYDGEEKIVYTVAETTGFTGYTASTLNPVADGETITNTETEISVSKRDINGSDELPGALIRILKGEEVVEEWTSGTEAHVIKGLEVGTEYTLREITAPDGYTLATDTTFSIKQDGTVDTTGSVDGDTLLINDVKTKVKISKVDITSQEEIAGATLQILDAERNVVVLDGTELSWVSSEEGPHIIEGLKTGVTYTLHEETAPDGYTVAADTTFTIGTDGTVNSEAPQTEDNVLLVEDALTEVRVSKIDIADGEEVAGAEIKILDAKGNVVDSWTSAVDDESTEDVNEAVHVIRGLSTGVTYTLHEETAPDGYTVAADTTFTIDKEGNVTTEGTQISDDVILVADQKTVVKVSKVDIADGEELEGAHIQIIDKTGKVVEEWDSSDQVHEVEGLKTGEEYTLRETVAPVGYTVTTDTTFTINEDGSVTSSGSVSDGVLLVEDAMTSVKISKVDVADGKEVEGAHIQIIEKDEEGTETIVEEWDSTDQAHEVTGLKTEVEYTLRETVAPEGYTVTTDTTFTIDKNGNVTSTATINDDGVILVEDGKTTVKVSKVDVADGEEVAGAHIQIIETDEEGNETIAAEWDSTTKPHEVEGLKAGVTYTLRETVAPEGYTVTADTTFTIDENGNVSSTDTTIKNGVLLVEDEKTSVKVSKVDIADGEEVEGATIQILENGKVVEEWTSGTEAHEVKGLKTGVTYTLHETVAPDGYLVATDTTFTIDEKGNVTSTGSVSDDGVLLVEDAKTSVKVSKVDVANGEELAGAHIQIIETDEDGAETVAAEWDSTDQVHVVEGLKTGVTYTLRETVAPNGYAVTSDTTFTIDENGDVTSTDTKIEDGVLLVEDALTKISVKKTDIANGEELEGAHIQIIETDEEGNETIVREWVSTKEAHEIEGLETEKEYTLRETVAPEGYTVTTDITFTIDKTGKVTSSGAVTEDGTLLINDSKTKISVSKVDIADGEELEGAQIQIVEMDEEGHEKIVESWTSGKEAHEIEGLKTGVEYILRETVAPEGYTVAAETTFTINENGKVESTATVTSDGVILVEDAKTKVSVSKTDIADGKELEGAHIQIIEKGLLSEKVITEWDSTTEPHVVEGLKTGVEYILRETVAPDGYTVTTDTKFIIDEKGNVTSTGTVSDDGVLLVEDEMTTISVSKVDIADGKELEGATIQILEKGEVVEEWVSGKKPHEIKGLKTGVEYTLKETVAPEGYAVTTNITFSIDEKGKVTSTGTVTDEGVLLVEDGKTKVSVSKVDIADGKELEGATIQIIEKDEEGNEKVVEEWTSGKEAHEIEGLKTDVEYTLRETVAPEGYTVTTDTTFSIDEEGNVTSTGSVSEDGVLLVEDAKTKVSVSKVDIADGEELEGAKIQIIEKDEEGNEKVVEQWTSGKEAHEIEGLKTGVEYTLRETVAPEGYTVTTDTTFIIDEKGNVTSTGTVSEDGVLLVEDAKTKVSVSKVDIADGEELEGAHIQIILKEGIFGKETIVDEWDSTKEAHVVEGLKTGVEYILRETVAPDGYTVTTDTKFSIDEKGNVSSTGTISEDGVLLVEDTKTKISVSKVDIANGEELEGAHIQILDSEGNVVEEWDSTKEAHEIEGLKTGEEYTLRETVAPEGYTVTTDTKFTIDEEGNVTSTGSISEDGVLLVEDAKTKVSVSKTDIADGEELEGAHIQILDSEGNVVEEWDSTKEAHVVEGLKTDVTYTLKETVAPDGYTVTSDTTFTIDEKGKVTSTGSQTEDGTLLVNDAKTRISVSKVDIADGKEIAGATIRIVDAEGKVVEEWVSTEEAHVIEGLKTGVEYTLKETAAPEGYTVAAETTFTIDEKGNVTTTASVSSDGTLLVEDAKTKISVSKVDIADGEELEGAHIQIIDKDGKVVEEWDSTKEAHETEGLKTGEEYTLRETVAPEGYTVTTDTTFTIDEKGNVTSTGTISEDGVLLVEDAKTKISVSKVDIADGEELEGAHIQILDSEGKVVEEWDSTKEAHKIEGLKTGEEYTLHETVAPEGHVLTTDTTFTIDEKGNVTSTGTISEEGVLLVEDAKTKVSVSKVDIADGKELEGAHIQIIDKDGNVVEEWDSTKEAHEIEGLKTGEEYTLRETVAPDGYTVTTDTTFTIDEEGNVTSTGSISEDGVLLVEDAKTVVKVSKTDIADGKEIAGAQIQIIDKDGNVVEKWTSGTEAHVVEGLKTGEEYTLRETVAPDGYKVTTDTKFTIDETGKVTSTGTMTEDGVMLVEDEKTVVKVSKVDIADGKELEGAHIQIIVKEGLFGKERVVEEWDSTKEVHEVTGLKTGVEYILRETVAPDGYAVTTDIKFTIDENGKVTSSGNVTGEGVMLVEDAKTIVKVSKVDITSGKELKGATIQILEDGKVIDEWVSDGKEPHVIEGLKTGVEYTLREKVAPEGYELTADSTFTIDKYGKVTVTGSKIKDGVILIEDALKEKPKNHPEKKIHSGSRTGDDANAMLWLLLVLGASGSLAYVVRRRKRQG